MISKIEAWNYRCLADVSQSLGHFHIITGPNGSGKSTFLEVPQLLAAYATGGLDDLFEIARARSLDELFFQEQGVNFELAVEAKLPENLRSSSGKQTGYSHVRYEVSIGYEVDAAEDKEPKILAENLWLLEQPTKEKEVPPSLFPRHWNQKPGALIHKQTKSGWRKAASKSKAQNSYFKAENTDYNLQIRNPAQKSALSTLPEDEARFPLANWFKAELSSHVQKIMLKADAMMAPSSALRGKRFAVDGSNLPQVVRALKADGPSWKGWMEHLQTVLPIADIHVVERPEDKALYLKVRYVGADHAVNSWHLSDGTLRLLALTLLAYIKDEGNIYLIEEPENGVHPQAIESVFQSLTSLYDGQVIVATHSPVMVAQAQPEQLLCFAKADGATDIVRGDLHPKLRPWQSGMNLAQLYAAGILS